MKRKKPKRRATLLRTFVSLAILLLFYFFAEKESIGSIEEGNPPAIFSNQSHDDLRKTYLKAIDEAEKSIVLIIYTLSDKTIIDALNKRADEGIQVSILHDPATCEERFSPRIKASLIEVSGLMHQKILVVDEKKVWIGSANFTKESLKVHDNLVVAVSSQNLANRILQDTTQNFFNIGGQDLEFWTFPKEGKEGLTRLIELLDQAKNTIRVAMFTWTHPLLTDAVVRASKRGVKVEIVMDHGQGMGVNAKALAALKRAKLNPQLGSTSRLLHHKFVWIDKSTLVSGSANWTKSAFTKNADCFVVLHHLSEEQNAKLEQIWTRAGASSKKITLSMNENIFFNMFKEKEAA